MAFRLEPLSTSVNFRWTIPLMDSSVGILGKSSIAVMLTAQWIARNPFREKLSGNEVDCSMNSSVVISGRSQTTAKLTAQLLIEKAVNNEILLVIP
jgi:hypothetical protein